MELMKWCLLIILVVACTKPASAAPQYVIRDLGLFGGTSARLSAVNNSNVAVGIAMIGPAMYNAIL